MQIYLWEDVLVDGRSYQPDVGHKTTKKFLHWCAGYCWLWDLWCKNILCYLSLWQIYSNSVDKYSIDNFVSFSSTTAWSSCASTSLTRNCNSFSTTPCLFWNKRSTRRRALFGSSLTSAWTWLLALSSLRRFLLVYEIIHFRFQKYTFLIINVIL